MRQLALDGTETDFPARARGLTQRQRELLRYVRAHDVTTSTQAGRQMHAGREVSYCSRVEVGRCCAYASSDGSEAMKRLAKRGLVRKISRGRWEAVIHDESWR